MTDTRNCVLLSYHIHTRTLTDMFENLITMTHQHTNARKAVLGLMVVAEDMPTHSNESCEHEVTPCAMPSEAITEFRTKLTAPLSLRLLLALLLHKSPK